MTTLDLKADLALTDAGEISGIAWPYQSGPDKAGDLIEPGALKIPVMPLPMLLKHNAEEPIGLWEEILETVDGILVKGRLFIDESKRARAVFGSIKGRLLGGLSVNFEPERWIMRGRNRVYTAGTLVEVSVVKSPSHPRALITNAKSMKDATAAYAEALTRAAVALRKP